MLRRAKVLRPCESKPLQRCHNCNLLRRLGRPWLPPDATALEAPLWWCEPCWWCWRAANKQWFVQATRDQWDRPFGLTSGSAIKTSAEDMPLSSSLTSQTGNGQPRHFHFVEVGTSHYHTFTQAVAGHPDGKPYAWNFLPWNIHPLELSGLAVDMQQGYLDLLPDLPNVSKVCAALSERLGEQHKYHVPQREVELWEHIFAKLGNWNCHKLIRLARGCSALRCHHMLQRSLGKMGLQHLARLQKVRTSDIGTLFQQCNVGSIGVLALDCEGYDCSILKGLMSHCDARPLLYPAWIWFESNGMNDQLFGEGTEERTVDELKQRGYQVWWGGGYEKTGMRDTLLSYGKGQHDLLG